MSLYSKDHFNLFLSDHEAAYLVEILIKLSFFSSKHRFIKSEILSITFKWGILVYNFLKSKEWTDLAEHELFK